MAPNAKQEEPSVPASPLPAISSQKGGGAIHGIGETFSTNAMSGTASMTVPIAISPGRSGFTPQLSLTYDTASGNGVFGLGWSLSLPEIARKTQKGLPRYHDAEDADVFILSGYEDLVPSLREDDAGGWDRHEEERSGFRIRRYQPRIEGLFARIERWTSDRDGDTHWRVTSKDNVLTIYGDTPASRVSDPENRLHVFKWLIASSYDPAGNAIVYEYVAEDLRGVDCARPSEQRRGGVANRYIKRIRYGNRTPLTYTGLQSAAPDWMFEVVFDFGDEHDSVFRDSESDEFIRFESGDQGGDWPVRRDPFSTWRSGFELRTYRLCRRALMFHHFPEELGKPNTLVRSTDFGYDEKPIGSLLTSIAQSGYRWTPHDGTYLKKSLPPLTFGYAPSPLESEAAGRLEWREADHENLPEGIDGGRYRWVDLDGEGIAGVLSEQGGGWYFKRNLGDGRFGRSKLIMRKPASGRLDAMSQILLDVGGEGQLDLVDLASGAAGFYERAHDPAEPAGLDAGWGRFRPFRRFPVVDWSDRNLRFVDLTGDGIADVLITEDVAFRWHPSLGRPGFGPAVRIPAPADEDTGPHVVFSDPMQSIYLADMSGDGLTDIVRIRNGEVCYWPNRGYGRFGAKIVMDRAPWFDAPGLFDNRRIRLADTDGSGTTDIIYLGAGVAQVYLNESGNALSAPRMLDGLPDRASDSVSVADFLGRGTACLVWSSPLPAHAQRPLRYVDLMRGRKPYLLTRVANNLGTETVIEYASSTRFYLADRAAGQPWLTPLPFPVHVVCRVETFDAVGRHRFVSTTSYHHGFYDGVEREFRGFGRVDQYDTETFTDAAEPAGDGTSAVADNEAAAWRLPPVLTRTWYHTGVFRGADRISRHLAHEYYHAPDETAATGLDDTILPQGLAPEEAREACRSLKGTRLRQEIYALDGSDKADIPYSVTEGNATIRLLRPRGPNLHSVFFVHPRESLSLNLERTLYEIDGILRTDPRIDHSFTLEVDAYGNPLLSASIAYGRRHADRSHLLNDADRAAQATSLATITQNRYTNAIARPDAYRTPLLAETRVYELVGLPRRRPDISDAGLLRFDEVRRLVAQAGDGSHYLPFEDFSAAAVGSGPFRRLITAKRTRYRSDDLHHLLPLGQLEALALPGEGYSLVLTPGLVTQVYGGRLPSPWPLLRDAGGYLDSDDDGRAWAPSGRTFYSADADDDAATEHAEARRHFFLPRRFRDAFGNDSHVTYDPHDLVPVETRDPVGNITRARIDYRVLQPDRIIDPNGNRSDAAFDALGRVVGTAVMGKETEAIGDSLDGFVADLPVRVILEHLRHPLNDPWAILGNATTRLLWDAFAFDRTRHEAHPAPAVTCSLVRETHVSDLAPGARTRIQQAFCYSDGFGREAQHKLQAEPGRVPGHANIRIDPRWVGSGWTIFNNKGKPVRQYEPFFSATHAFEFAAMIGVSATLVYDPVGRVVATLNPEHTFQKAIFDPWRQEVWDSNDSVLLDPGQDPDVGPLIGAIPAQDYLPTWYQQRAGGALGTAQAQAAAKAAIHQATPGIAFIDPLGRVVMSVAHNRFVRDDIAVDEFYPTRSTFDIQGNERAVTDALGRIIVTYDYDVTGRRIHQHSRDSGSRWTVNDVDGNPILGFDSRHHRLRYEYDRMRRPTALFVRTGDGREQLAERSEYGEAQPNAEAWNLRGRLYREYDGVGIVMAPSYDYKGNLLQSTRQMLADYREQVDWASAPRLEAEIFASETSYDALNRPVTLTAPDKTILRPLYNDANLLEQLAVSLKGAGAFEGFVRQIDYNARGQRVSIAYGNGARTTSDYDPLTFRLTRLKTRRDRDDALLQDLSYVYDPVGNITAIEDGAQQAVYFKNQVVRANGDYVYDAVYRLLAATGREHAGARGQPATSYDDAGRMRLPLPGDGHAMHHYREHYRYDAAGNILELIHAAPNEGSWRRHYGYDGIATDNRLSVTQVGSAADRYGYDANGNMTRMGHLPVMRWDFRDRLAATQTQVINNGDAAPTTYYVYDAGGQRARKVTEDGSGRRRCDRIYLAGFEIYREYDGDAVTLERTTLHVMDDKRRVALVDSSNEVTAIRYQYDNNIGSSCLELDETAAVITYEEYYPYGSTSYQAGRSIAEVSRKRYRFTGKERDDGTGFSYHRARYYAPWLGRWVSCDPVGLAGGINAYLYAAASPLCLVDPNGTQSGPPHPEDTDIHQFWPREDTSEAPDESSSTTPPGGTAPGVAASVWNWVKNAAASVWSWIKGAASSVGNAIAHAVSSAWNWVKQAAATAWDWTKQAAATVKQAASTAWDWTKGAASTAWNWTKGAAATAWNWTKGAAATAWDWIKGAAATVWNWALAPLIRTATNAAFGVAVGFALGGVHGAIVGGIAGAVTGAIHAWGMASAHSYDWSKGTGWAEFLADNTWSLPNSAVGSVWATLNIWNPTNDALSTGSGKLVFDKSWASDYATTFGNVTAGTQVPLHEGTHALQARIFGPLFYPSLIVNYAINTFMPFWLLYHDKRYPNKPITTFGQYFSRGVYPHVWAEDWAYSVEGAPQ